MMTCNWESYVYPVIGVNVHPVSEKRLDDVHVASGAGQGQGALPLPRNSFGVCTLKHKRAAPHWPSAFDLSLKACGSDYMDSDLLQEKIHHCFLSKRCCPHERGKAPFILFAEQRAVCKTKRATYT